MFEYIVTGLIAGVTAGGLCGCIVSKTIDKKIRNIINNSREEFQTKCTSFENTEIIQEHNKDTTEGIPVMETDKITENDEKIIEEVIYEYLT